MIAMLVPLQKEPKKLLASVSGGAAAETPARLRTDFLGSNCVVAAVSASPETGATTRTTTTL